ncbi:MAG: rhodanese-like domain-containing protein [Archangium sp.]|nr:rhodanese-like domain-containing protein [Archangium sp.]
MKKLLLSSAIALSLAVPSLALACDGAEHQAAAEPKTVSIAQVAMWTKEKKATPVDANGKETRSTQGVIPGAVLLTSSSQFDAAKELPAAKDTKLVFYCANTKCSASDAAAKKAMQAGYTDVAVLREGIAGWKQAGQPTSKPNS